MKTILCLGMLAAAAVIGFSTIRTMPSVSAENVRPDFADSGIDPSSAELSGTYQFDPNHTTIGFRVKHMGLIEVPGYFRNFSGTINYDAKEVAKSSVEFTAEMTSVDTGVSARDNHLRTKDFFEVETYPQMKFKSKKIEKRGQELFVTGDLTMKDVTREISFPFTIAGFVEQRGQYRMGASAQTTINRRDFNVNYGGNLPNGAAMVSDDVKVDLQIEALPPKKAEPADSKQ